MSEWKKVKIGELLTRYKEPVEIQDEVVYNRVTIKTKHKGVKIRDQEIGEKIGTKKQWRIKEGQFILSRIDARFGAIGMIPKEVDGAIVTNDFLAFDVNEKVIKKYLFLQLLKSPIFLDACRKASRGVTQRKRVDEDFLLNYEITIPQIEIQEKIVRLIQQSETKCKQLDLKNCDQKAILKELRKQILQDAISGKLTKHWRRDNPDIQPASELLKLVKVQKEKMIKEKRIKKERALSPIQPEKIPFELPEGWVWTNVGDFGFTQTGTTPPTQDRSNFGEDVPFIKPADIKITGTIDYSNEKLSKKGLSFGRSIQAGSVLMVCIGGSIGKSGISINDISCNQQINAITPLQSIDSSFVQSVFQSPYFQKTVWNRASGGTTPIVNKTKWETIPIPLPPLVEQRVIVAKVDKLMEYVAQLEEKIAYNVNKVEILIQSFLSEAFKT